MHLPYCIPLNSFVLPLSTRDGIASFNNGAWNVLLLLRPLKLYYNTALKNEKRNNKML